MADVSANDVSGTVSEEFFEEDHEGAGTETISEETKDGTEEETEDKEDDTEEGSEESTDNISVIETVEGEEVTDEEPVFETTVSVDDTVYDTQNYTNYFSFLIAVVLGLGAVICWAKGFTE